MGDGENSAELAKTEVLYYSVFMNSRQRHKYKKYRSLLWKAIQQESLKRVRKLLRFVKTDDDMVHSAIALRVSAEIVDLLQKSAGMPESEVAKCRLSQALEADDTEQVQQYLNTGMSPDVVMDSYGNRPLHRARSARMARLLLEAGADVNGLARYGESPVFFARGEVLETLLAAGADASIIGKYGQSALMNYHPAEEIRMLLAAGANPYAVWAGGYTALHSVVDAESVAILVQRGLDVNARCVSGDTPLFRPHNPDVARALLDAGADPCAVNKEGVTPLHECTCSELAEMLLAAGAHVNAEDEQGRTPLDWAMAHPYQHKIQKHYIATLIRAGGKRGSAQQGSYRSADG